MNTGRILTTTFLILLVAAPAAWAQSPGDPVGTRWVEGAAVDEVYSDLPAPVRDLRVQVWHPQDQDEEPYRRGESFELYFETNADAYVVIYRIDVDGRTEVLWPTSRYDDGFVYGNHTYTLPRPGSPNRLTASRRKGVEYVQAIASELPFDLRNLSIDFRFDLGERGDYEYVVAGDPFLAVNDINFAITGLEEDVDYVVTDWSHLYVESRVDYARYSCTQCHAADTGHVSSVATTTTVVRPYVDTCTTVNVYADWGWQRRWYGNFGWYPLYYEPAYYYWDPFYGRPYWYSYYPVFYSWPRYPIYTRPYYWYDWHASPWYRGDYRVRYTKGYVGDPLYDFDRVKTRRRDVRGLGEIATGLPASIERVRGQSGTGRISKDRLVKDRTPSLVRGDLTPRVNRGDDRARTGIRRDRIERGERRLTSLAPDRARGTTRSEVGRTRGSDRRIERDGAGTRTERRWTRPVIRNEDRGRPSERSRVERDRDTRRSTVDRDRAPARDRRIERDRTPTRRVQPDRSRPERRVQPDRSRPERRVQPQRDRSPRRVEPKRDAPQRRVEPKRDAPKRRVEPKRSAPKREVERSRPAPPRRPQVKPQRSAPKRSEPSRGGSRGGGGSRTRNGGGGRG